MSSAETERPTDRHTEYRTLLAEKRTLLAEGQMALLLVTVPLTIHTGLTMLATRHQIVEKLHILVPFWLVLGTLFLLGVTSGVRVIRRLRQLNRVLRTFWQRVPSGGGGHPQTLAGLDERHGTTPSA